MVKECNTQCFLPINGPLICFWICHFIQLKAAEKEAAQAEQKKHQRKVHQATKKAEKKQQKQIQVQDLPPKRQKTETQPPSKSKEPKTSQPPHPHGQKRKVLLKYYVFLPTLHIKIQWWTPIYILEKLWPCIYIWLNRNSFNFLLWFKYSAFISWIDIS